MAFIRSRIYEITNVNSRDETDTENYVLTDVREGHQTKLPPGIITCYNVYLADIKEDFIE